MPAPEVKYPLDKPGPAERAFRQFMHGRHPIYKGTPEGLARHIFFAGFANACMVMAEAWEKGDAKFCAANEEGLAEFNAYIAALEAVWGTQENPKTPEGVQ